ncbi:MAG TPA: DUF1003 domain-containing protein [Cytophagaceae bacterium]|jgi:uncharacterized membrane protein
METENNKKGVSPTIERNVEALLRRNKEETEKKTMEEKTADAVTRFTGSMLFVYLHLILFGLWILWNCNILGLKPFDPSFVILAMFASVEAIFLSTFVLISQNRMNLQADKRANLDLQISLFTEHEVTRIITLVAAMAKKMNIDEAHNEEMNELSKDIHPEKVLDAMEEIEKKGSDKKENNH